MKNSASPLRIAPRYTRSVHVQRDFATVQTSLVGYQVTPLVFQTIERVVDALRPDSHTRAFSIIGPYGAGKSAFALFLSHYLSEPAEKRHDLIATHSIAGPTAKTLLEAPVLLPVLLSGNNSSLRQSLLVALHESLVGNTITATSLLEQLDSCIAQGDVDPQQVADLVEQASHAIAATPSFDGLVIVVDELGQHLNYAAHQKSDRDLFVLQTLAEMASRSRDVPCMIITILHQAFDRYVGTGGIALQTEWAKVQGRFVDIPFFEPDVQLLRMVGYALCSNLQTDPYADTRQEWAHRVAPIAEDLGLRPASIDEQEWHQLMAQSYPLHPTVLVALPLLFRQLAQNERSLFAFVTSYEPWSLQEYIASQQPDATNLPIYRLPHLYAYIDATLGPSLFARSRGRRWAELAEACIQASHMGAVAQETLKVIGTLNAFGQSHSRSLRASGECVAFALHDTPDSPQIESAIEQLQRHRHIVYRTHRESFVLWEGSDLDIDGMVQTARLTEVDRFKVAENLQQYANVTPMVARRHSYRTGAIRLFDIQFVSVPDLPSTYKIPSSADGIILYVVAIDDEELVTAQVWAAHEARQQETQRLVVLPQQVQRVNDVLLNVVAIQHVLDNQPELENDRVARRELSSQLIEAQQALTEAIDATYGLTHSVWWWRGQQHTIQSRRQLDDLLSEVCSTVFPSVPHIWNELLVRRHLSSAATKARRNLIEAMLDHGHEECLGITGYPPERAMYESVLRKGGLHRVIGDGMWGFGAPPSDDPLKLTATWNAIQEFISSTQTERRPVQALYDLLAAPPYGIKSGLLPVLFITAYLEQAGDIALYQHGNYVPVPDIAIFEMLLKHPHYFAIRQSRVTGMRVAVYERLAQLLAPGALTKTAHPALLDVVKPILRIVTQLPDYSKQTEHVSEQTSAIRQCVLATKSPDELLFTELPQACGLDPFDETQANTESVEAFFTRLQKGLTELQTVYTTLIESIAEELRCAFQATATDLSGLQHELVQRYRQIATATADSQIRAFGMRVENGQPGHGWIESIGLLLQKKAMKSWCDSDADQCKLRIADLGRRFCDSEQMAVAVQAIEPSAQVVRIGMTDSDGEKSILVHAQPYNEAMQKLKDTLTETINSCGLATEQQMVVLKEILDGFLSSVDRRNGQ